MRRGQRSTFIRTVLAASTGLAVACSTERQMESQDGGTALDRPTNALDAGFACCPTPTSPSCDCVPTGGVRLDDICPTICDSDPLTWTYSQDEFGCRVLQWQPTSGCHFQDAGSHFDSGTSGDSGAVESDAGIQDSGAGDAAGSLTIVTLNTHSFQEGPSSLEKLEEIGRGLADLSADLIGLNEVMSGEFWSYDYGGASYDGTALIKGALESASGVRWYGYSFGFAHWSTGETMSNVILSRFPIIASDHRSLTTTDGWPGPREQRAAIYARVEVPSLGWVNFFVAHAALVGSRDTVTQIAEIKQFMVDEYRGDEALDLLVGDLNTPSTSPNYSTWISAPPFRLIDTYFLANPEGFEDTTLVDGMGRIDYVMAGEGWELSDESSRSSAHLTFDGQLRDGLLLPVVSDHKGVLATFRFGP